MPIVYNYPEPERLEEIAQEKIPQLSVAGDPIFRHFPVETLDDTVVKWEQKDNYRGMQALRGLGGRPSRVQMVGSNQYLEEPGYYGEFVRLDETELTKRRRRLGTTEGVVNVRDMVMEAQDILLHRRFNLLRFIAWTLALKGTFSVAHPDGGVMHQGSYATRVHVFSDWSDYANATPLADLRALKLLARGFSVSFGPDSVLYLNQTTMNWLLANRNQNDLAGRRADGLAMPLTPAQIQSLMAGEGLPRLEVYEGGYEDEAGDWKLYVADGEVVVFGQREDSSQVGAYKMTLNMVNPNGAPGAYQRVIDRTGTEVPPNLEVHDGHNGGPTIWFPSAIVRGEAGP